MAEMVIGPKGEMQWDASNKVQVLSSTGSWVFRERARNAALDWRDAKVQEALKRYAPRIASFLRALNDISDARQRPVFPAITPYHRQRGTMKHNEGKIIGVESNRQIGDEKAPVYHSLRIDVDDDKGPHYNVMVSTKTDTLKACFRFDAPKGKDPKEWVAKIQSKWSR
jgi:hypothetical protein